MRAPAPEVALAVLALLPLAAVEFAKAARWRALFGPYRPPYWVCLRGLLAGQLVNALSPVRAGEAVRLGVLAAHRAAVVPGTAALAGSKAIDAISLAAIAAAVIGAMALSHVMWGVIGGGVVIVAGALLALRGGALRSRLEAHPLSRKLRLAALVDVAQILRDPHTLLVVLACTGVVWGAGLAANAVVLAAAGIPPTLDLAARVIVAGYLVNMVPGPPARVGVFETGVTLALTSAGVGLPEAVAASVTLHICQLVELGLLMAGSLIAGRWAWSV